MVIFCMILRYREKSFNPAVGIETAFSNSVYFSKTYTMLQGFFFFVFFLVVVLFTLMLRVSQMCHV